MNRQKSFVKIGGSETENIIFVHTESCQKCKGQNLNYRTRMCCRGCDSLLETKEIREGTRQNYESGKLTGYTIKSVKQQFRDDQKKAEPLFLQGMKPAEIANIIGTSRNRASNLISLSKNPEVIKKRIDIEKDIQKRRSEALKAREQGMSLENIYKLYKISPTTVQKMMKLKKQGA